MNSHSTWELLGEMWLDPQVAKRMKANRLWRIRAALNDANFEIVYPKKIRFQRLQHTHGGYAIVKLSNTHNLTGGVKRMSGRFYHNATLLWLAFSIMGIACFVAGYFHCFF